MTLQELYANIKSGILTSDMLVFKYSVSDFVPLQYVHEIARINNLKIEKVDEENLPYLAYTKDDIFSDSIDEPDNVLHLLMTDKFDFQFDDLLGVKNLIIICESIEQNTEGIYHFNIVDFPKLEAWQIRDYAYSNLEGLPEDKIDFLVSACNGDMFKLSNEIRKLNMFISGERNNLFDKFVRDGVFSDLTTKTIFDLTESLLRKDYKGFAEAYKEMNKYGCEPMAFYMILLGAVRDVVLVQLNPSPSEESTGMEQKQIYAIKKYKCGYFDKKKLENLFEFLSSIDIKIKSGEMPMNFLIDYIIAYMFSLR